MLSNIFSQTTIAKPSQNFLICSNKTEFTELPAGCNRQFQLPGFHRCHCSLFRKRRISSVMAYHAQFSPDSGKKCTQKVLKTCKLQIKVHVPYVVTLISITFIGLIAITSKGILLSLHKLDQL